jgi:uncharacterized membrane protein
MSRFTSTTKNARRLSLTLLAVLAILGLSALAVLAAGGKATFTVSASPSSQTVTTGQSTSYTVTVTRVNGFTGPVTLSTGALPAGASASWKLADGTSTNVVPATQNTATLTVATAASTPTGSSFVAITGTNGKLGDTTTVTLVVQPASQPNLTVTASPVSQTIPQGDSTTYGVTVERTNFSGPVGLSVSGLPGKVTASFSPASIPSSASTATLQVETADNVSAGSYDLTITATATSGATTFSRTALVTLIVQKKQSFLIEGDLASTLFPGRNVPLDLQLTNPSNFDLQITNLAVAVDEGTSEPVCSGTANFKITQFSGAYGIVLHPGTTSLSALVADSSKWPQVEMLNLAANQDACKNASIVLRYSGSAVK